MAVRGNKREKAAENWRDRFPDGCVLMAGTGMVSIGAVCTMQELAKAIG